MKSRMVIGGVVLGTMTVGCSGSLNVGSFAHDASVEGGTEFGSDATTRDAGFEASVPETGTAPDAGRDVSAFEASMPETGTAPDSAPDTSAFDAGVDASTDSGPTGSGDGGDGGACAGGTITFNLTIQATGLVYPMGPTPPWPVGSFGCPGWLAIAPANGSSVYSSSLNLERGGGSSCPIFLEQPQPATAHSFAWDGTYYPRQDPADASCIGDCLWDTPVCVPSGNYVATMCVGYAGNDAGVPETSPPTCEQVPFVWPPTSANQTIDVTIAPTPDGGTGTTGNGTWINRTQGTSASGQHWTSVASDASGNHLIAGSTIVIPPLNLLSGAWVSTDASQTWTYVGGAGIANAVASNATGTVLLAVPGEGSSGFGISTSPNSGATWTVPTSPTASNGWGSVASDSAGTHLVAAATFGDIWTSTDFGTTWTDVTASGPAHQSLNWVSVASSADGTHLVAVEGGGAVAAGTGATGDIWTSSDSGATWTDQTSSGPAHNRAWESVASDATGTNLVAVGSGIWTSSDSGVTWTERAANIGTYAWVSVASSSDGSRLVAATMPPGRGFASDSGDLWTSSDSGKTWVNETAGTSASGQDWTAVASDSTGTHLVAVAMVGDIWTK